MKTHTCGSFTSACVRVPVKERVMQSKQCGSVMCFEVCGTDALAVDLAEVLAHTHQCSFRV